MPARLALIFFLSGSSALVFEALWFRLAGLSLGNSVWSASLVLAAFMGGLALGNWLAARRGAGLARPIRLYAFLELLIGMSGLAVVIALPQFPSLLGPLFTSVTETAWVLNGLRLSIAFGVLLVPATAMGITLPILTEAMSRVDSNFGAVVGKLYGWNTLGAMLGAIVAEAVLIELLGITATGLFAAALNLMAALLALGLSKQHEADAAATARVTPRLERLDARSYRYLIVAFASGAVMLALEIVWFRFLQLSYPGTGLVFALMLGIVLGGIALGGLIGAQAYRADEQAHAWLRAVLAAGGACVVITYAGFDLFTVRQIANGTALADFVGYAVFLMLPVAVLSGISFTMTARGLRDALGSSAATIGIVTLGNTIGAMLGSLVGGFVLLPWLGMERSLLVLAIGYVGTALLAPTVRTARSRSAAAAGLAAIASAVLCLAFFPFGLMQRSFLPIAERAFPDQELVAMREGLTETSRYYVRRLFGEPHFYRLATNGHSMSATTTQGKRYMKLYVYLPVALRAQMHDALLISYGVGSTAKALTDTRSLRHIDVVDVSRDVLEMNAIVYPGDDNPLADARVQAHIEDGRFFLNTTQRQYDLITSEPPPPKLAGIASLYSEEYFGLMRARLTQGGYATYWLPVYQLTPFEALAITKAFCNAFDDCSLWAGAGLEWMLMGSNGATETVSREHFEAQWRDPVVGPELVRLGFETPAQMAALFMADAELLRQLTAEIPPVTDNYPLRISSHTADDSVRVPLYAELLDADARLARFRSSALIRDLWPASLATESERYFVYERAIKNLFSRNVYRDAQDPYLWDAVDDVLTNTDLVTLPLWLMGSDWASQAIVDSLRARGVEHVELDLELAIRELASRHFERALAHVERYVAQVQAPSPGTLALRLYLMAKTGRVAEARAAIEGLSPSDHEDQRKTGFIQWFTDRFAPAGAGHPQHSSDEAAVHRGD